MTSTAPKLLNSVGSIASRCDVSARTVRNWIASGKIKPLRLGGRVLIPETEIQRFLDEAEKERPADDGPRKGELECRVTIPMRQ